MEKANPIIIILQWRKWSHFQPIPNPTALYFSSRYCKTTCRPITQEQRLNLIQFPASIQSPHLIIKRNLLTILRRQQFPAVSAAVSLQRTSLVFPTHRFRTAGVSPRTMGSLDSSDVGIVTVDVTTAKTLLHSGYDFLDVRTVEEFKEGHVATEKIVNIPYLFNSPNGRVKNERFLEEVTAVFKKNDRLVVGCRSGVRSLLAIEDLQNDGFKHLKDLGGGHLAWLENGFPVAKPTVKSQDNRSSGQANSEGTDPKVLEDLKAEL